MTPEQKKQKLANRNSASPLHNSTDRLFDVSLVDKPTLEYTGLIPVPEVWSNPAPSDSAIRPWMADGVTVTKETALVDGASQHPLPFINKDVAIYEAPLTPKRVKINPIITKSGASFSEVVTEDKQPDEHGVFTFEYKLNYDVFPGTTYMYGAEAHDLINQSLMKPQLEKYERKIHFPATLPFHEWWAASVREQAAREMTTVRPDRNGVAYAEDCVFSGAIVKDGPSPLGTINVTFTEEPLLRSYMDQWIKMVQKPEKED